MFPRRYVCDVCGLQRDIKELPRVYELPDGRQLPITQRHDWCKQCEDVSPFEIVSDFPENSEFWQESLASWRDKDRHYKSLSSAQFGLLPRREKWEAEYAERAIANLLQADQNWKEWRRLRSGPSRCLCCRSPANGLPVDDFKNLIHSACGGALMFSGQIGSSSGPEDLPHVYSVEGELLRVGSKPRIGPGLTVTYESMELFCPKDLCWSHWDEHAAEPEV